MIFIVQSFPPPRYPFLRGKRKREVEGKRKRLNEMKRERVIIYCFVGDCRHRLFVITLFHCFFAGLHFRTVHLTMAIQSSMNGFSAARLRGSIRQMMF